MRHHGAMAREFLRPRSWSAWVPALLLLFVCLPLTFQAELALDRRLANAGSVLELLRPRDSLGVNQMHELERASRRSMARLALQISLPGNPLALSPQEQAEGRQAVAAFQETLGDYLWEMHQFAALVDEPTLERHRRLLFDPDARTRYRAVQSPEAVKELVAGAYGGLPLLPGEERPPGWSPEADPALHELWTGIFVGPDVDRTGDAFLIVHVRNLLALHLEDPSSREGGTRAADFAGHVLRAQVLAERLRHQWFDLYRVYVLADPDRVAATELGRMGPEIGLEDLHRALRRVGGGPAGS